MINGTPGISFATRAPISSGINVIGNFYEQDEGHHAMCSRGSNGVWESFIPDMACEELDKFEIRTQGSDLICPKTYPYAQQIGLRPRTAPIAKDDATYSWQNNEWMDSSTNHSWRLEPLSIYECHLGLWQQSEDGEFLNYRDLSHRLDDYVNNSGFTDIELLPITEQPLKAFWDYQTTGDFFSDRPFCPANDFRLFVDNCHQHDIGVLLDEVPAHFPKDEHGLTQFDGRTLYEHEDPKRSVHRDWAILIYNYGRNQVKDFLISNAIFWSEEYHLDSLRVEDNKKINIALNFTPAIRDNFHNGIPSKGEHDLIYNSNSNYYSCSKAGSNSPIHAEELARMNRPSSLVLTHPVSRHST